MKNYFLILSLSCFLQNVHAQKDVSVKINHLLDNSTLVFNQTTASNNMGNNFQITRLQYYISDIVLHHDNMQTPVTGKFILTNSSATTNELLGSFNINTLDSISFGIGVGPNENHLDPSSYQASHPLAPKSPSMHWGWTSGYRFVAIEGLTGNSMSDVFQMHGLGDSNYKMQSIVTAGVANGNNLDVVLDADYTQALRDINLTGGVISHGETGQAKTVLDNFNLYVFSEAANSVPITKIQSEALAIYPNPIQAGNSLTIDLDQATPYSLNIYDCTGRLSQSFEALTNQQVIQFKEAGLFIVTVLSEGNIIHSQKVSVHE